MKVTFAYAYTEGVHVDSLWREICSYIFLCGLIPFAFILGKLSLIEGLSSQYVGIFLDSIFYSYLFLFAWKSYKNNKARNSEKRIEK
jgi:hypothetical protein